MKMDTHWNFPANIIKNTGNNTELIKNYEIKFLKGLGKLDAED